jgi:hypothetical protein
MTVKSNFEIAFFDDEEFLLFFHFLIQVKGYSIKKPIKNNSYFVINQWFLKADTPTNNKNHDLQLKKRIVELAVG